MKTRPEIKMLAKERLRAQRAPAILLPFVGGLMGVASAVLDEIFGLLGGPVAYWIAYWAGMLVLWVMHLNMCGAYVKIYEQKPASVGELFTGLGVRFFRKLGGYLWMCLWLVIWSLPSIAVSMALAYLSGAVVLSRGFGHFHVSFELTGWVVLLAMLSFAPVVIKGLSYFMTAYILGYHTEVKAIHALRLSKRMTRGYKGHIFVMGLSFIGWILLGLAPILLAYAMLFGTRSWGVAILLVFLGVLGTLALFIVVVAPYMHTAFAGMFVELRDHAIASGVVTREELCMEEPPFAEPTMAPPIVPVAEPPLETPVEVVVEIPAEESLIVEVELEPEEEIDEVSEEDEEYVEYEEEDDLTEE